MKKNNFADLVETFAVLRGPNGCPWDKKQTHESLIKCLQNESQELIDAIQNKDDENMKEELGDVLLQVLMHSQIAAEEGKFTIEDVIQGLYDKLHRRHPHVFGAHAHAATPEEALALWKEMKKKERAQKWGFGPEAKCITHLGAVGFLSGPQGSSISASSKTARPWMESFRGNDNKEGVSSSFLCCFWAGKM